MQEIGKRQLLSRILLKACDFCDQSRRVAVGGTDIVEYVFCCLFLKLHIAALRQRDKAVLDFARDASGRVGEQCGKFIFKVILFVCLSDEVQHGQAFFIFRQTESASELLQKYRQRFCGT